MGGRSRVSVCSFDLMGKAFVILGFVVFLMVVRR